MNRYRVLDQIGDGTYGSVWKAIHRDTNQIVAVKKMKRKYYSLEECVNLREVKSLRTMQSPHIVKLKEVIRERDELHLVFEYMEFNLYQIMKKRGHYFRESQIRSWCYQVFQGLAHIHKRGYFHRDMKPENLLVTKEKVKIADFGLAKEIRSRPPFTDYVSTRWYRAPEILLRSPHYGPPVDVFAMGAIMAELYTLRPLLPGHSETDQIYRTCSLLGTPTHETWSEGLRLAAAMKFRFPRMSPTPLARIVKNAAPEVVDLIKAVCQWNPEKRPTAVECLQHPYFHGCIRRSPMMRATSERSARDALAKVSTTHLKPLIVNYRQPLPNDHISHASPNIQPSLQLRDLMTKKRENHTVRSVIGQKISLHSQGSDEKTSYSLPLLLKCHGLAQKRATYRMMPLNHQTPLARTGQKSRY